MKYVDRDDLRLIRRLSPLVGINYRKNCAADDVPRPLRLQVYGAVSRAETAESLDSIRVARAGNFGNNVIQLVNALMIAEEADIPLVRHDFPFFGGGPRSWPARLKRGKPSRLRREVGLRGRFFKRYQSRILKTKTAAEFLDTMDRHLRPAFRWTTSPTQGVLALNLRGGNDIFTNESPPGHYGQPPLSYFIEAAQATIAAHEVRHIVLVHQDKLNPVLPALAKWAVGSGLPVTFVSDGPKSDAKALLAAEHIVMGCTTFTESLALLSAGLISISTFGRQHLFKQLDLAVPFLRRFDDDGSYIPTKMWTGSLTERALMLNFPAERMTMTETTSPVAKERRARLLQEPTGQRWPWL